MAELVVGWACRVTGTEMEFRCLVWMELREVNSEAAGRERGLRNFSEPELAGGGREGAGSKQMWARIRRVDVS